MALTFLYRDLDATDTDITPYVVLRFGDNPQGMAENAEERSVGSWELDIEDDGVLDLHAQRTFYVLEDDTPDVDDVLWVGQTFDKHSARGGIYRTGAGRVYTLSLIDLNTLLERRLIQEGDDPNRPEETDVERMLWLQGLGYIGVTDDWISTDDPVDMDAVDYTGRMASEVIEDCSQQSTKNAFMFRDPDADTFAVFYGDSSADVDVLTSDIRLSNVLSDIDNVTTWEVNLDADQWEANSRIYSGMFGNYDGGAVYVENATTVANFSHRDTTMSWPDVKTATKATARATRQLAIIGSQEFRITCAVEVGSDQVGLFPHAGWRLQVRFSHFPQFAVDFTWMRILSRNTTLIGPNRYRIQYELSPGTPISPLVCGMIAAGLTVTDTGQLDPSGTGHNASPVATTQPTPSSYPAVVYTMRADVCRYSAIGSDPTLAGPTTQLYNSRTGDHSNVSTWLIVGYQALGSGSPSTFSVSWTGLNQDQAYRALSIILPTSATAPIHTGEQNSSGGSITLDGTPTPGNILILAKFSELDGFAPPDPPPGFTRLAMETISGIGIGFESLELLYRCVEEGDTDTFGVGDAAHPHWASLSEWVLA